MLECCFEKKKTFFENKNDLCVIKMFLINANNLATVTKTGCSLKYHLDEGQNKSWDAKYAIHLSLFTSFLKNLSLQLQSADQGVKSKAIFQKRLRADFPSLSPPLSVLGGGRRKSRHSICLSTGKSKRKRKKKNCSIKAKQLSYVSSSTCSVLRVDNLMARFRTELNLAR